MCRLMIEFIKNNESYIELQLNIFRKSHQNRTKFVAFQIVTTEFCSVFYAPYHPRAVLKEALSVAKNSTFGISVVNNPHPC